MAKGKKTGGRQAGTPNKVSGALREDILQALANKGGVTYLEGLATNQPVAFATLLGKVLPMQVTGEGGGALVIRWEA